MDNQTKLTLIQNYVYHLFKADVTGHDFHHMQRVAAMAKQISCKEKANIFICEVSAWVHDIGDKKLFSNTQETARKLEVFLQENDFTAAEIKDINVTIEDISFSKGKTPETMEGKIVQDADRLDAIGAIGIARTFAYGGANDQLIWDEENSANTSVQHFYDKLLKLKDTMHTETAKKIAVKRHRFMEMYIAEFFQEW